MPPRPANAILSIGLALAVILITLAAGVLFLACRQLQCSPLSASVAAVAWLLGNTAVLTSTDSRQYSLLGLLAIAFFACLVRFLEQCSAPRLALLVACASAGLLTHFHFAILLAVSGMCAAIALVRASRWRALAALSGCCLLAIAILAVVYRPFLAAAGNVSGQLSQPSLALALSRLSWSVVAVGS